VIELHGGEVSIDQYPEKNLSLTGITHVISITSDFPDYHAACDALIPVVRPNWIEHSLAKDRLANTRQYSPDPRMFMSDVVACVADLPEGDADAIAGGILAMGGLFSSRLTGQVTHIVALSMDNDKCDMVQSRNLNIKVVLPHWFDDCLKLGRKIDEQPYLLPDPDILRNPNKKAPNGAANANVTGATNPDPSDSASLDGLPARGEITVFRRKNVMLASDLGIGPHLRKALEEIIIGGEGKIVKSVPKANMFICKYRSGQEYKDASRNKKDVGNLAWLYYLITTDTWTSPLKRLLHYPIAREGIPGFRDLKISLSNYSGEARIYLENVIIASGAECTKTLKQDNSHLVTAHVLSEKCAAAKDWGINIVNHLWIEESYAKWKLQSITDSRYTHFPRRTNLGEVVGQTQIDRDVLVQFYKDDKDVEMTDAVDEPKPMQQKNTNTISKSRHDNDVVVSPRARSKAGKPGQPKQDQGAASAAESIQRTPAASRFSVIGKENVTPSTTSSRKSKDVAAAKLHSMTPDIALYEKERKRVGGVVYGGRKKNDEEKAATSRKRSMDEAADTDATEEMETKKSRKTASSSPSIHLLISGYKKWVGHPKVEETNKKQLRNLGVVVTLDPSRATHLAAPQILRTHKFVTALAYAPIIISTDFIDACLEHDELLDPADFELHDETTEKRLGVTLKVSQERAKQNQNQLLQGRCIYCVENIHGGFDVFKSIVEANGGQCMQYRGRSGQIVPSRRADNDVSTEDDTQNEVYLLSGPNKESSRVWNKFKQMAEGSRKIPRIVSTEWLLESAMCQEVLPVENYALAEAA